MSHSAPFSGVLTAIATPFNTLGHVDEAAFTALLRAQKRAGIHGVVVCGTTGESPTLSELEKARLVQLALAERTDTFRVYVGTGSSSTAESIAASRAAVELTGPAGARIDGVMIVVPYYNKPTQASLLAHFKACCEAVKDTPVCVYNVPGRTGTALSPATFEAIARSCRNVRAIKEAAGNIPVISDLARRLKDAGLEQKVELLSGDDPTFAPALAAGATGVISVSTHVIPKSMLQIWTAWKSNDLSEMTRCHLDALELNEALFCASNPIPLKWALHELGFCEDVLRLPLVPLDNDLKPRLRHAMDLLISRGVELCRFAAK